MNSTLIETTTIPNLVKSYEEGKLKPWSNKASWSNNKIEKFLQSIYKNYPLGSIMLWEPKASEVRYILDGVQRIQALCKIIKEWLFQYKEEFFCLVGDKSIPMSIPMSIILNRIEVNNFYREKGLDSIEYQRIERLHYLFKETTIPVLIPTTDNIDDYLLTLERD